MAKKQMYFPRTYRRFEANHKRQWLFIAVCVLPFLLAVLLGYTWISKILSEVGVQLLSKGLPPGTVSMTSAEFLPLFGGVYFITLPTVPPTNSLIIYNLLAVFFMLVICLSGKRMGTPIAIFFTISGLIHLVSCIFFLFGADAFPYTANTYSELYMKQQVGIWLSFITIVGFITAFLNDAPLRLRVVTFFGILLYSFVFGSVRYIVFLYVISAYSTLYMPSLFFTLGPFFDFLYLVYWYGVFLDLVVKRINVGERRAIWKWF